VSAQGPVAHAHRGLPSRAGVSRHRVARLYHHIDSHLPFILTGHFGGLLVPGCQLISNTDSTGVADEESW